MSIVNLPVLRGATRETRRPDHVRWRGLRRALWRIAALLPAVHRPAEGYVWAGKRVELDDHVDRLVALGYMTVGHPRFCYVPENHGFAWKVGVRCPR